MSGFKLKVLVADDSAAMHHIFAEMAQGSPVPFELIRAENGRQCMELLNRTSVNLAFIDVNMPEMSGLEAVAMARHGGNQTFVTLMSGISSVKRLEIARQLKVYEYLHKPFIAADVYAILQTYCRITVPSQALLVDDSATVRRIISKILNDSIFNIDATDAGSGEQALELFDSGEFDVVFLDCNMPGVHGTETLEHLLERDPGVKVIMNSAEKNEERRQWALKRGATAFLYKPFYPADVDRILHGIYGLNMPLLTETVAASAA
jgi:CheY-like chemotaxis protein